MTPAWGVAAAIGMSLLIATLWGVWWSADPFYAWGAGIISTLLGSGLAWELYRAEARKKKGPPFGEPDRRG